MASAAAASLSLPAQVATPLTKDIRQTGPTPRDRVRPTHDLAVVTEFVSAAHRDFEKVKAMVAQDPKLVLASVDTGNIGMGDWETALNGAAHTGHRDIAMFLLLQGARIDAFCAAMLGYSDVVLALLKAESRTAIIKGPHGLTLLYHAAIGGEVLIAEALKPLLPAGAADFNQALSAAARDGRLDMTKWLLANGVTNVNAPDGFRKTPLKIASEKGHDDVASVLRKHGGRETL
ncbi:MAG: ankyrin repeat domain-containing protein [Akkermansiaceae bacterium]|nr:ankyrin repeat domain-containing protein [Verrucomicrobiales bacterium]